MIHITEYESEFVKTDDPPPNISYKDDGTDKYKFNLTAIIDDDISHSSSNR